MKKKTLTRSIRIALFAGFAALPLLSLQSSSAASIPAGEIEQSTAAVSEGIPLKMDVFIDWPIQTVKDLPDEITFKLYPSETTTDSIASQTFRRGEYTVEFEFSASNGISFGHIARFSVDFSNPISDADAAHLPSDVVELWAEIELDGSTVTGRQRTSTQSLVDFLVLNSESNSSSQHVLEMAQRSLMLLDHGTREQIDAMEVSGETFSTASNKSLTSHSIAGSDGQIQYNNGGVEAGAAQFYYNDNNNGVGIGTSTPQARLDLGGGRLTVDGSDTTGTATPGIGKGSIGRFDIGWGGDGGGNLETYSKGNSSRPAEFRFVYGGGNYGKVFFMHYNGSTWVTNLVIDKDGRVGIGTTTPQAKLDVAGEMKFTGQKACSSFIGGNWRDTILVPSSWSAATCQAFTDKVKALGYNLFCIFEDSFSVGVANGGIPFPNCGW